MHRNQPRPCPYVHAHIVCGSRERTDEINQPLPCPSAHAHNNIVCRPRDVNAVCANWRDKVSSVCVCVCVCDTIRAATRAIIVVIN